MSLDRKFVIVGATSAIARHCAHAWLAAGPADFILVGRDAVRLERAASDLRSRSPDSAVRSIVADFLAADAIRGVVDTCVAEDAVETVLIAHGMLPEQTLCEQDLDIARDAIEINAVSPVLFAEAFAGAMATANSGTLVLIGSVAGDRGRKSNYVYGASKGLIERYAEGLQHRLAASAVRVVLIKPGPTRTPMTAHLGAQAGGLADVDAVARQMVRAIDRGVALAYVPGKWRWIMAVIRRLPRALFNRLDI